MKNILKIQCGNTHTKNIVLNNIIFSDIESKNITTSKNNIMVSDDNIEKLNVLHDELLQFEFDWNDIEIKNMYIV